MRCRHYRTAIVVALALLLGAGESAAQWAMVGRAAANRVRRMTQNSGSQGYDVATVVLEAPAERVYQAAIKTLEGRPDVTLTKQDSKNGKIQFRKGDLVAGLQVSPLGDKLSQLVIASSASDPGQPSATSLVVERVLGICQEMKVECSLQSE